MIFLNKNLRYYIIKQTGVQLSIILIKFMKVSIIFQNRNQKRMNPYTRNLNIA